MSLLSYYDIVQLSVIHAFIIISIANRRRGDSLKSMLLLCVCLIFIVSFVISYFTVVIVILLLVFVLYNVRTNDPVLHFCNKGFNIMIVTNFVPTCCMESIKLNPLLNVDLINFLHLSRYSTIHT